MRFVLTALAMIGGIVFAFIGLGFFFTPVSSGADFGLQAGNTMGLAVLRADMTAFFLVGAVCLIWGAWKRNGELLLVPAGLFGIAFTGRLLSAIADGTYPQFWLPMTVELSVTVISIMASRLLPHRAVGHAARR